MRTQLIETRQMAGNRNGRTAAMLHSVEDVAKFLSRMGQETAPVGCKAAEHKTRPGCYSAFLSKPSWITTGVFAPSNPRDCVGAGKVCIDGTWIRTGVFKMTALTGKPTPIGKTGGYNAFLSRPTWIRTGIFWLSKTVDQAGAGKVCIDGTWIRTGIFELTNQWGRLAEPLEESLRSAA